MDIQTYAQQVEQAARRANELRDRARLESQTDRLLEQTLEQLHTGLAELEVASRALRERSLAIARHRSAVAIDRRRRERLFASSPIASVITDARGATIAANAAAAALLGTDVVQPGNAFSAFVASEDRQRLHDLAARAGDDDVAVEDLLTMQTSDRRCSCHVRVLVESSSDDAAKRYVWMLEDRTTSAEASAANALRTELRRRDAFLRALGPELRNPLAPMRSAVELWRDHGDALTSDQRAWTMEVVSRSADHLAHLVDDLLDVSRLTHGKIHLARTRVDLRDVLESAYEAMRSQAQLHEVAISTPGVPVWIEGDAMRLRQVVANLLANALEYTPKGRRIGLRVAAEGACATIAVWDEGVGLAAERLEAIFGMFAHTDHSLSSQPARLGLRLPLVRRMIELHGGTVHARSEGLGRGSEFLVRLPLATDVELGPPPATDSQIMRLGRRRLLVVDDNVDAAEMLTMLLESEGHVVTLAFDGASALASFQHRRPDVVLLDIGLPDMDGLELARRLQSCAPEVPLVALTGYGDEAMRARTRAFGFAEHLLKPVDFEHLRRVVFEVERSHRPGER